MFHFIKKKTVTLPGENVLKFCNRYTKNLHKLGKIKKAPLKYQITPGTFHV